MRLTLGRATNHVLKLRRWFARHALAQDRAQRVDQAAPRDAATRELLRRGVEARKWRHDLEPRQDRWPARRGRTGGRRACGGDGSRAGLSSLGARPRRASASTAQATSWIMTTASPGGSGRSATVSASVGARQISILRVPPDEPSTRARRRCGWRMEARARAAVTTQPSTGSVRAGPSIAVSEPFGIHRTQRVADRSSCAPRPSEFPPGGSCGLALAFYVAGDGSRYKRKTQCRGARAPRRCRRARRGRLAYGRADRP